MRKGETSERNQLRAQEVQLNPGRYIFAATVYRYKAQGTRSRGQKEREIILGLEGGNGQGKWTTGPDSLD